MTHCLTTADCYAAGWADGETDSPMTKSVRTQLLALHAPHFRAPPIERRARGAATPGPAYTNTEPQSQLPNQN